MTAKELRKLRRADLLEMLMTQMKENESLKQKMEDLVDQLNSRNILLSNAGSIAEAAVRVNGVFQAAQEAGDQYLENLERLEREKQEDYRKLMEKSETECRELREKTELECRQIYQEAEFRCQQMKEETEAACHKLRQETKDKCEEVFRMVRKMIEENI